MARWLTLASLFLFQGWSTTTTIIDSGSPSDASFTGGTTYQIPPALLPPGTDSTLRFSDKPFSYLIPCQSEWPYVVTFRFIEPTVKVVGQRVFSVKVGSQVVVDKLDLVAEAGYLKPISRSVVVLASDGALQIRFETQVRSSVISSIEIRPLLEISSHTSGLIMVQAGPVSIIGSPSTPAWEGASGWRKIFPTISPLGTE